MNYYHVRITQKSDNWNDEVGLDYALEDLTKRILEPYRCGRPITLGGKAIAADDIERVRITKTDQESTYLRPAAERERQRGGAIIPPIPVEWYIADMGDEVTNELITGAPGEKLEVAPQHIEELRPETNAREVFVVHGRNIAAREELFNFLRAIDLRPLEWSDAVQSTGEGSPYIGQILDAVFSRAHAVVVLFTPDDEARLKKPFRAANDPTDETELTGQARPNVLFEAGMAMAQYPKRTILVEFVELGKLRPFSDVVGRHVIRLDNASECRQELAQRLQSAGCPVDLDSTGWHRAGNFGPAVVPTAQDSSEPATALEQQSASNESLNLSDDAKELLIEAAKDSIRTIRALRTLGGLSISTNSRSFVETGDANSEARSEARWEQAIRDLVDHGLIEDPTGKGQIFEVTHSGFQLADSL